MLADDEHFLVFEFRETGHDRAVVAERAVPVQLHELVEDQLDVVERLRALRVPRHVLDDVPRIEVLERLPALLIDLEAKVADGFPRAGRRLGFRLEGLELPFELANRLFEWEFVGHRRGHVTPFNE